MVGTQTEMQQYYQQYDYAFPVVGRFILLFNTDLKPDTGAKGRHFSKKSPYKVALVDLM